MRLNLEIDEVLIAEAMKYTGHNTKKAVIEEALRALIRLKSQEEICNYRGKLKWEGDLDAMRAGLFHDDVGTNKDFQI